MLKDMSLAQLESVIAASFFDAPQSGSTRGWLDARGLIASDLKRQLPTEEILLEGEDAIKEALAWKPLDLEDVLVGTHGGEKLAEMIGADVWTHGNLWREEDRELTREVCAWFADYVASYVAELRKILTELAGTLPS